MNAFKRQLKLIDILKKQKVFKRFKRKKKYLLFLFFFVF